MLDFWIIEKIKEERKIEEERPRIQLPMPEDYPCQEEKKDVKSDRGVIVIKIGGGDEEEES